jgi:hypothetical protein
MPRHGPGTTFLLAGTDAGLLLEVPQGWTLAWRCGVPAGP